MTNKGTDIFKRQANKKDRQSQIQIDRETNREKNKITKNITIQKKLVY